MEGRLTLFGHGPTSAAVELRPRSRRWRTLGAARILAAGFVAAPVAALVPPHAPWALGALAVTALLARRRLRERMSLVSVEGPCPRCGEAVRLVGPTRLLRPHPVPCEACHHEPALHLEAATPPLP